MARAFATFEIIDSFKFYTKTHNRTGRVMTRVLAVLALLMTILVSASGQLVWQKSTSNPVLPFWTGDVDEPNGYKYTLEPWVIFDSTLGIYRMWFSSLAFGYGTRGCISTAISPDGQTWYTYSKNPVLKFGSPGDFDDTFLLAASVICKDSLLMMYYTGSRANGNRAIGLATSKDGIQWQKCPENPVVAPGGPGSWDSLTVGCP